MKDDELTLRIKSGDRDAFNELCRDRYASLFSYAKLFVDATTAEDVVQDVMFTLWQKRDGLDADGNLQGYLIRSVYNRCMNILKHAQHQNTYRNWYREKIASMLSTYFEPSYNPVMTKVYDAELGRSIDKAIDLLPPRCSEVFKLRYIYNLSEKEISERLGISVSTVENHIHLALRKLRGTLDAELQEI